MCGIYRIINHLNGHSYVGQSQDIARRWKDHRNRYRWTEYQQYPLHRAFLKYGLEHFTFEILEECSVEELNIRESAWIKYYDSINNGYNINDGGHTRPLAPSYVYEAIKLLENTNMTQTEIADKLGISRSIITNINSGKKWTQDRAYPIRPLRKYPK